MFCHPEHVHFHEVVALCERAAQIHLPYVSSEECVWLDEIELEIDFTKSRGEKRRIYEGIFYVRFLEKMRHKAYACSTEGLCLKLSSEAVRPILYNHFECFNAHFFDHWGIWLYIDGRTGLLDPEGAKERFYQLDEENFNFFPHASMVENLMPMQGWGVGFEKDGLPTSEDLVAAQVDREQRTEADESLNPSGRPRIREQVAKAYLREFPQGHGELSWKQVLVRLKQNQGVIASPDTLKRGLREANHT